jgi:hypothetical protein
MHDDTNDPRRDEPLANDSATAPSRPAEPWNMAQGLPLLDALAPTSALPAQPLTLYPLRLHKDPPLRRFGH